MSYESNVFWFTFTRSIIYNMLYPCVFQSFCLNNKSTVTMPVETFPFLTLIGYLKSNLTSWSVLIVSSHSLVSFCSLSPCPIGSVRLPPSLGLIHLAYRCALSCITTTIFFILKLLLVYVAIYRIVKFFHMIISDFNILDHWVRD